MADPHHHPQTLAVHAGYEPHMGHLSAKPPIYLTSTFAYESAQPAKDIHEAFFKGTGPEAGGAGLIYARLGHPNLTMVEQRLAALDGAEGACVFNSGMAATTAVAMTFLAPGDSIVYTRPIYGGTDSLISGLLARFGVAAAVCTDGCNEAAIAAAIAGAQAKGRLRMILVESPANPTAALVDLAMVVRLAAAIGPRPLVACDNTLLGPIMQRPHDFGVDLVITSLTKYCGGHSDLVAGGVSGAASLMRQLVAVRTSFGSHLDPFTAWLLLRSMETVELRMERAASNAATLAAWLRDHPKISSITYLGFVPEGSAEHAVYQRQCRAAGSTFSFRIKGGEAEAFRFLDRLRVLRLAVSLGGSETLITHPASTTHYAVDKATRDAVGVDDSTIRLSVGIEHVDDLIADLAQGLEAI